MESGKEEKEFTFYKTVLDNYTGVKTVSYKVKESELTTANKELMLGNLLHEYNKVTTDIQRQFKELLSGE